MDWFALLQMILTAGSTLAPIIEAIIKEIEGSLSAAVAQDPMKAEMMAKAKALLASLKA